jgi:hypothetical protein
VLPYDLLMQQLDISNVRELEDLLINDCMYSVGNLLLDGVNLPFVTAVYSRLFGRAVYSGVSLTEVWVLRQGIVRGKLDQRRRCFEVNFLWLLLSIFLNALLISVFSIKTFVTSVDDFVLILPNF